MVNSFASLYVSVHDQPVYCPQVKALLTPGNWVLFRNDDTQFTSDENEDISIGLIMATTSRSGDGTNSNMLEVNLFRRITKALSHDLCLRSFTNPLYQWIPQILRTRRCKWIDPGSIQSIAWVFQTQHLDQKPNEGHQGMSNLLLHYTGIGELISSGGCYPFCSDYVAYSLILADCYQERVWIGLQTLHAEICRHLGRSSEKQGYFTKVSSQVVVGREDWQFLLSKVERETGPPIGRNACISKRVLQPGLVLKSTKNLFYSSMLRFETEVQLQSLSSVLGELVTMEVRKRRPKYNVVESLHGNDVINTIAGSDEREMPFRHRTNKQRIDFVFDGASHVRIRIRYERFQYTLPLQTPSTILTRGIERKTPLSPGEGVSSNEESEMTAQLCLLKKKRWLELAVNFNSWVVSTDYSLSTYKIAP
jgi:hypothetical protein